MFKQNNDLRCFTNLVCASLVKHRHTLNSSFPVLSLWRPSGFNFLTSIFSLSSLDNVVSFSFCLYFRYPTSISVCHSPPFLLHPSRTLFKEGTSGSSCPRDKRVITLPLLGKPLLPDSFEVFRSHIFKTQGLKTTIKIMTEAYSIHKDDLFGLETNEMMLTQWYLLFNLRKITFSYWVWC